MILLLQNFSINYWIEKGANPKKLVMGVPLYGQSFSLAERNEHGLNAPTYGGGEAGEATRARGFLAYYEVFFSFSFHFFAYQKRLLKVKIKILFRYAKGR